MMKFIKDENGQGMLEYVLIIALVVIAVVAIVLGVKLFMDNRGMGNKEAMANAINGSINEG